MKKLLAALLLAASLPAVALATSPAAKATAAKAEPRTVEVRVTKKGFEPAEIKVKKGEPVRLLITRKVERTCATEVVLEGYGIEKKLPLNEQVTVDFTPDKTGTVRYMCGMAMIAGKLVVE